MKRFLRRSKSNNKGFSLVELIIGVSILAVVAGPLLKGMVTAAAITEKGRNVRSATYAAENIMEAVKASDMSDLLYGSGDLTLNTSSVSTSGSAVSRVNALRGYGADYERMFYIGDFKSTMSDPGYDVMITLDPDDGVFGSINSVPLERVDLDYRLMEYVYCQNEGFNNPDRIAAEDMAADYQAEQEEAALEADPDAVPEVSCSWDEVADEYQRTINVNIMRDDEADRIKLTIDYSYEWEDQTADSVVNEEYTLKAPDDGGNPSFYFFFYPTYHSVYTSRTRDIININNEDGVKINLYMIKEKLKNSAGEKVDPGIDSLYQAYVYVDENSMSSSTFNTNFTTNIAKALNRSDIHDDFADLPGVRIYKNSMFETKAETRDGSKGRDSSGVYQLVSNSRSDSVYKVTVELYKSGALTGPDASSAEPLYTLDSSLMS